MHKLMSTELGPAGGTLVESDIVIHEPKIVMLAADHDTQYALRLWAQACDFDLTRTHGGREITEDMFDFHITPLATANDVVIPDTDHLIEPVEVTPAGFAVLGRDSDTPVLRLNLDGLAEMRAYFIETYGAEPTFAEFKPHISLSYAWNGEPALEELELPDFPLVFDRLIVRTFEPQQKSLAQVIADLEGKADGDDSDEAEREARLGVVHRTIEIAAQQIAAFEETIGNLRRMQWPPPAEDAFVLLNRVEARIEVLNHNLALLDQMRSIVPQHDGEVADALDDLQRRITAVLLDLTQVAEELAYYLGPTGNAHALPQHAKFVYGG